MVNMCQRIKYLGQAAVGRRLLLIIVVLTWPPGVSVAGWPGDSSMVFEAPGIYERLYRSHIQSTDGAPTLSLTLSGGGARGLAQIGVLRAIEERGLVVTGIAGTSLGAIIGGLYAAGYSAEELDSLVRVADWNSFFSDTPPRTHLLLPQKDARSRAFLTLHFRGLKPNLPTAMTGGQPLLQLLTELCHAAEYHARSDFDSLAIPFRSVATDLVSGRAIILRHGDLALSLRAASAFPLALSPVHLDSMMLVDGGLISPIPVSSAREFPADLALAVNTTSELESAVALENIYNVANQSTTIMTRPQSQQALTLADVVIAPLLHEYNNLDFDRADTIIALGYSAACRVLDSLLAYYQPPAQDSAAGERDITVDSVAVSGLDETVLEHREIIAYLRSPSGDKLSLERLEHKLHQVIDNGQVRRITLQVSADPRPTIGEITISPYPRLREVVFDGNSVFPNAVLAAGFSPLIGRLADTRRLAEALRSCLELYEAEAYSLVEIRAAELDDSTGRLRVVIDEGRLSGLEVAGNTSVKDWVITRHFPLQKGRLFNFREFFHGLEDLHATGLFNNVGGRIARGADGPIVKLNVREKDYDIVRFGLRHDLEYQTDVFAEVVNSNLLGLGNEIYIHAGYCPRRERYAAGVHADRMFRTYLNAAVQAYREIHERYRYVDYHRRGFFETARTGLMLTVGHNIKRFAAFSANVRLEDIVLTEEPPLPNSRARLRAMVFSAQYDDLDRYPFSRHGRKFDLSVEFADDFVGGNVVYRKACAQLENWLSPIGRFTIGQRITLGVADRVVPDYERFALGGRQSMMGLHDDEFLGDKLILGNLDCRVRFFSRSYMNFRLDVGGVWEDGDDVRLIDDLRVGTGAGPSFDTPLGPLELMWGIAEDDLTNFYFNWGYDF
jgi:NTE family protein